MYIRTLCAYVPSRYFFVIFIVVVIYLFIYYSNVLGRIGVDEQTDCTPVPCRYLFFYVFFLCYFVLLFIYFRVDRSWRAERWYIGALLLFLFPFSISISIYLLVFILFYFILLISGWIGVGKQRDGTSVPCCYFRQRSCPWTPRFR